MYIFFKLNHAPSLKNIIADESPQVAYMGRVIYSWTTRVK